MNWHVICSCVFCPDLCLGEVIPPGNVREIVTAPFLRKAIRGNLSDCETHLDQGYLMEMIVLSEQMSHVFIGKLISSHPGNSDIIHII